MTIFLGCGFAAKYREGGGNFSVPLQWMLGLHRLKLDAIWLELLPATDDPRADQARIDNFQRQLRAHGLAGRYCLLYQKPAASAHDLDGIRCVGMSKRALLDRLTGAIAGCRNHLCDGKHFIPLLTRDSYKANHARDCRNSPLLDNGTGAGRSKWLENSPTYPKELCLNLISVYRRGCRKRSSN